MSRYTPDLYSLINSSFVGASGLLGDFVNFETPKYPPHDIITTSDDTFEIHLAVAGFKKEEITIEVKSEKLTVTGSKKVDDNITPEVVYTHKGIAKRDFTVDFKLYQFVIVDSAEIVDGILIIKLHREVPEEYKARKLEIK